MVRSHKSAVDELPRNLNSHLKMSVRVSSNEQAGKKAWCSKMLVHQPNSMLSSWRLSYGEKYSTLIPSTASQKDRAVHGSSGPRVGSDQEVFENSRDEPGRVRS